MWLSLTKETLESEIEEETWEAFSHCVYTLCNISILALWDMPPFCEEAQGSFKEKSCREELSSQLLKPNPQIHAFNQTMAQSSLMFKF